MAGGAPDNAGRVTTQEFYKALLRNKDELSKLEARQNDKRDAMEERIMDELKGVPTQVNTNTKEIDALRNSSNIKDVVIAIGAAIGTAAATAIGRSQ